MLIFMMGMIFVVVVLIEEIGVLHWKLNAKDYENDPELEKIRNERGYNYMVSFQFY